MEVLELATLWAAGVILGATFGKSHGALQLLPSLLISAGAVAPDSFQHPVWVAAILYILYFTDVAPPGNSKSAFVAARTILIFLAFLPLYKPLSVYSAQIFAASLIFSGLWRSLHLSRTIERIALPSGSAGALLIFLSLLTGLLLLLTGVGSIWLLQLLVLAAILVLGTYLHSLAAKPTDQIPGISVEQAVINERERIYQNLHDDIGSRLLSLIHRSSTPEEADFARCLLQDLRDAVARTVQLHITLPELIADQKSETEQRLHSLDMEMHWPHPKTIPDIPLPPVCVAAIKRSLRELISNIIRHAKASTIHLDCRLTPQQLELRLLDDGTGLLPNISEGRGMSSIRNRLQSLGGSAEWSSTDTGGTQVKLHIPIDGESTS